MAAVAPPTVPGDGQVQLLGRVPVQRVGGPRTDVHDPDNGVAEAEDPVERGQGQLGAFVGGPVGRDPGQIGGHGHELVDQGVGLVVLQQWEGLDDGDPARLEGLRGRTGGTENTGVRRSGPALPAPCGAIQRR